jgi:hypothetical protein
VGRPKHLDGLRRARPRNKSRRSRARHHGTCGPEAGLVTGRYMYALWLNLARFPLCERENIGNFAALVGPGVDRPELIAFTIPDSCGVVWGKPSDRRRN